MTLKRTEDETSKKYWDLLKENSEDVASWPEWKKGHRRIEAIASQTSQDDDVKAAGGNRT